MNVLDYAHAQNLSVIQLFFRCFRAVELRNPSHDEYASVVEAVNTFNQKGIVPTYVEEYLASVEHST